MKIFRNASYGVIVLMLLVTAIFAKSQHAKYINDFKVTQETIVPTMEESILVNSNPAYKFVYDKNGTPTIKTNFDYSQCDICKYKVSDTLKNSIIDDNGQKRIRENVGRVLLNNNPVVYSYNDNKRYTIGNFVKDYNAIPNTSQVISSDVLVSFAVGQTTLLVTFNESLNISTIEEANQYLNEHSVTITYGLAVKNSRLAEPNDFSYEFINRPAITQQIEHSDYIYMGNQIYHAWESTLKMLANPFSSLKDWYIGYIDGLTELATNTEFRRFTWEAFKEGINQLFN